MRRTLDKMEFDADFSVPPEELAAAARLVLHEQLRLPRDELYREMLRPFGIQRLTQQMAPYLDEGLRLLLEQDGAREQDGTIEGLAAPPVE